MFQKLAKNTWLLLLAIAGLATILVIKIENPFVLAIGSYYLFYGVIHLMGKTLPLFTDKHRRSKAAPIKLVASPLATLFLFATGACLIYFYHFPLSAS